MGMRGRPCMCPASCPCPCPRMRRSRRRMTRGRRMFGGEAEQKPQLVVPNQVYAMEYGTSPRSNALKYAQVNDEMQLEAIKQTGAGVRTLRYKKNRKRHTQKRKGGAGKIEVPSFAPVGISVSPINNNSNSVGTNQSLLDAKVAACNDCHATNTCGQVPSCAAYQQGGIGVRWSRKYRKAKRISQKRRTTGRKHRKA